MSETKHAPRPWRLQLPASECGDRWIVDANGHEVVGLPGILLHTDELAEFIVRACNSHDELLAERDALLAALEYSEICMRDAIRDGNSYNFACLVRAHRQAEELIAAIAKAKPCEKP